MGGPPADEAERRRGRRPRPAPGSTPIRLGSALAALHRPNDGLFFWGAWTVAGGLGLLSGLGLNLLEALAWSGLDAIDLAPSGALFGVVYAALSGAAMSATQFAVIRLVLGNRSSAARAWIPVTTALEAGGAVVLALWFRGQTGATLPAFVAFAVTTVVQGLLLAEIFGRRSALFLWLIAMALFSVAAFVVPVMAIYNAIADFNTVVAVIAVDALIGLFYGAVGGAFLVWPAMTTKAPEPAARSLPEPTP